MTSSDTVIFFALLAAAFCVGVGVFFGMCARRPLRSAGTRWLISATVVLLIGFFTIPLDLSPGAMIFFRLILPVWVMGGLLGLLVGAIRYKAPKS